MNLTQNSITQNKPAIFDWLVFTISLLLGFIFPSLSDLTKSASFSYWMLATVVLYIAGLWLKHRPVYYRLAVAGKKRKGMALVFLITGHWIVMLAVVIIAEDAFRAIAGLPPVLPQEPRSGISIFTATFISLFISWLAFRPGSKNNKQLPGKYLFKREMAGDILLISAVSILSFVFWEKSLVAAMGHMPQNGMGDIFFLFIFLCFAYLLFYMPLRYLYLIEDDTGKAWQRLLLIFILILIKGLWQALR